MTPRQILGSAQSEEFTWVDYFTDGTPFDAGAEEGVEVQLELLQGLSSEEIVEFEASLPGKLPEDIRELLTFASGFSLDGEEVPFSRYNEWGYDFLLPHVIVLSGDGCGNSWVIEINDETGEWRHVWFECHDPPVLAYQCETLAEFITARLSRYQFEKCQAGPPNILSQINAKCHKLWRKNGRFQNAATMRDSDDPLIAQFAASLDDHTLIADLRHPSLGDGFDWTAHSSGPRSVDRAGTELLFGIRPSRGLLGWLFGR